MSYVIENYMNKETIEFKHKFESELKQAYYKGRDDAYDLIDKEIDELKLGMMKADAFDNAVLSVLVGYLVKIKNEIIDLEYEESK